MMTTFKYKDKEYRVDGDNSHNDVDAMIKNDKGVQKLLRDCQDTLDGGHLCIQLNDVIRRLIDECGGCL